MQLVMILKKCLLMELEKNLKKKILRKAIFLGGRACFGWVGRSTANQHFFKVGPKKMRKTSSF